MAAISMMNQLDILFTDQWAKEADNAWSGRASARRGSYRSSRALPRLRQVHRLGDGTRMSGCRRGGTEVSAVEYFMSLTATDRRTAQ